MSGSPRFTPAQLAGIRGRKEMGARMAARKSRRDYPGELIARLKIEGLPEPVREHCGIPGRRFRFDLAYLDERIAIECHGGEFINGGHNRGQGLAKDCTKANLAQLGGWLYLAYTGKQLTKEVRGVVDEIRRALELRRTEG